MAARKHSAKTVKNFIKEAEAIGMGDNFLFLSTLERYEVQVRILEQLKESIENDDVLVTKEYVKGRGNLYTHPAITEFNKTTDSANKTVETLDKLLKSQATANQKKADADPLLAALGGGAGE